MNTLGDIEDLRNENESLRKDLVEVEKQRDRFMEEMTRCREKAARLESENERLKVTNFNLERLLRTARQETAKLARATTISIESNALPMNASATEDSSVKKDISFTSGPTQSTPHDPHQVKQEEVIDLTLDDDAFDQQSCELRRNPQAHSESVGQHVAPGSSAADFRAFSGNDALSVSTVSRLAVQRSSSPVSALTKSPEEMSEHVDSPARLRDAVQPAPAPFIKGTATLVQDNQPAAERVKVEDAISKVVADSIVAHPPALDFAASETAQAFTGLVSSSRSSRAESPMLGKLKRTRAPVNCTEVPEDRPRVSKRPRGDIGAPTSRSGPGYASSLSQQVVMGQSHGASSEQRTPAGTSAKEPPAVSCVQRPSAPIDTARPASGDHPPSTKRVKVEQDTSSTRIMNHSAPSSRGLTPQLNPLPANEKTCASPICKERQQAPGPVGEPSAPARSRRSSSQLTAAGSSQSDSTLAAPANGPCVAPTPIPAPSAPHAITQSVSESSEKTSSVTTGAMSRDVTLSAVGSNSTEVSSKVDNSGTTSFIPVDVMRDNVPLTPVASTSGRRPENNHHSHSAEVEEFQIQDGPDWAAIYSQADPMQSFLKAFRSIEVNSPRNLFVHQEFGRPCQLQRSSYTGTIYPSTPELPANKNRNKSKWEALFLHSAHHDWLPAKPGLPGLIIVPELGLVTEGPYPAFRCFDNIDVPKRWEYLGDYDLRPIGYINEGSSPTVQFRLKKGFCSTEMVRHLKRAFRGCRRSGRIVVMECQKYDEEFNDSLASLVAPPPKKIATRDKQVIGASQGIPPVVSHRPSLSGHQPRPQAASSAGVISRTDPPTMTFTKRVEMCLKSLKPLGGVRDSTPVSLPKFHRLWPCTVEDQLTSVLPRPRILLGNDGGTEPWYALFLANRHMPRVPGSPGLVFALDLDLIQRQTYSIFCLSRAWPCSVLEYMGDYVLRHAGDLSTSETETMPYYIRDSLRDRMLETGKYSSLAAANEALRTGAQVVHVLTLECTSFDEVLQALFTNPDAYDSLPSDTDDGSEYEP